MSRRASVTRGISRSASFTGETGGINRRASFNIRGEDTGGERSAAQNFFLKGNDSSEIPALPDLSQLQKYRRSSQPSSVGQASDRSHERPKNPLASGSFRVARGDADTLPKIHQGGSFRRRSMIDRTPTQEKNWNETRIKERKLSLLSDPTEPGTCPATSPTVGTLEQHVDEETEMLLKKAERSRTLYRQASINLGRASSPEVCSRPRRQATP
eukprot:1194939-Prorocentrum_minimum.AAC.4